jgi:polysaccharide export outer membrane protein
MKILTLSALLVVLLAWSGAAGPKPLLQEKVVPPVPQQKPPQPDSAQKSPVTLSPALPLANPTGPDPSKMAQSAPGPGGKTEPGVGVDRAAYIIGPEDQLNITVWEDSHFNASVMVRPDGKISLPLVGEIKAIGLTPLQLEAAINEALKEFLVLRHSNVQIMAVRSKKIYFDGDGIANTGAMELVVPIQLLEAISAKGGFKEFADKKHVRILRDGKTFKTVNYNDILRGKHPETNIFLQAGDHIIVN